MNRNGDSCVYRVLPMSIQNENILLLEHCVKTKFNSIYFIVWKIKFRRHLSDESLPNKVGFSLQVMYSFIILNCKLCTSVSSATF